MTDNLFDLQIKGRALYEEMLQAARLLDAARESLDPRISRLVKQAVDQQDPALVGRADMVKVREFNARVEVAEAEYKAVAAAHEDCRVRQVEALDEQTRQDKVKAAQRAAREQADEAIERAARKSALANLIDPVDVASLSKRLDHVEVVADDAELLSTQAYMQVRGMTSIQFERNGPGGRITMISEARHQPVTQPQAGPSERPAFRPPSNRGLAREVARAQRSR